ncbi:MAG TPA: cohesin domain-containing protein [Candidatus Bathyarchaeia archaeon]
MKNPSKATSKIILTILFCILVSFVFVSCVSAQSTVVRAEASNGQPHVGDTLTVNIKISSVQNLFGLDVTLNWNPSVLSVISATSQLGVESHSGGVLHETSSYPIDQIDNTASQSTGQYHLLATSTGSASSFSGSGTIATLTFRVTSTGSTGLALTSELSDHPATGGTANLIVHTDAADSVTAVASGPSTSVTPTPTSTTGSSTTPQPSSSVPEFPNISLIALFIIVLSATLVTFSTKMLKTS